MNVIALLPVDTTGLPTGPDIPPAPKPPVEHTLYRCDRCPRDCWIGPAQLRLLIAERTHAWCYFCLVGELQRDGSTFSTFRMVNANADDIWRRT